MLALKDKVLDLVQGSDVMANVDLMRSTQLPTEPYDYGFPAIRFVGAFSESLARRMSIGEKGRDVFDYYHDRAGSGETVTVQDPVIGGETEHKVPGELLPAATFILLMIGVGAGEEWLADKLFGIPAKNASMAEILMEAWIPGYTRDGRESASRSKNTRASMSLKAETKAPHSKYGFPRAQWNTMLFSMPASTREALMSWICA